MSFSELMQCRKYKILLHFMNIKEILCRVNLYSHIHTYMSHSLKLMHEHTAPTPTASPEEQELSNQMGRSCGSLIWRVWSKGG